MLEHKIEGFAQECFNDDHELTLSFFFVFFFNGKVKFALLAFIWEEFLCKS